MSHLRFGDRPINSTYRIQNADLISVHTTPYLKRFPQLLDPLNDNGVVIINSPWTTLEQMEKALPNFVKRKIAKKKAKLFNVDATTIARESGLRGRINMIMQGAFFKVWTHFFFFGPPYKVVIFDRYLESCPQKRRWKN